MNGDSEQKAFAGQFCDVLINDKSENEIVSRNDQLITAATITPIKNDCNNAVGISKNLVNTCNTVTITKNITNNNDEITDNISSTNAVIDDDNLEANITTNIPAGITVTQVSGHNDKVKNHSFQKILNDDDDDVISDSKENTEEISSVEEDNKSNNTNGEGNVINVLSLLQQISQLQQITRLQQLSMLARENVPTTSSAGDNNDDVTSGDNFPAGLMGMINSQQSSNQEEDQEAPPPMLVKRDGMFACSGCTYVSKHRGNVKMHIRTVHYRERPFRCCYCRFSAPYKGKLVAHVRVKHPTVMSLPFICPTCPFGTQTASQLEEHVLNEHGDSPTNYSSSSSSQNNKSSFLNTNEADEMQVDELSSIRKELDYVKMLKEQMNPQNSKDDADDDSEDILNYRSLLENTSPLSTSSSGDNQNINNSIFSKLSNVPDISTMNKSDQDKLLENYSIYFPNKDSQKGYDVIKRQRKNYTKASIPSFSSLESGENYMDAENDRLVIDLGPNGGNDDRGFSSSSTSGQGLGMGGIHKCLYCNYSSSEKSTLRLHVRSEHRRDKPYKCRLCPYSASQKANLSVHIMAVHERVKPYPCNFCSYTSSYKGALHSHVKTNHPEKLHLLEHNSPGRPHSTSTTKTVLKKLPLLGSLSPSPISSSPLLSSQHNLFSQPQDSSFSTSSSLVSPLSALLTPTATALPQNENEKKHINHIMQLLGGNKMNNFSSENISLDGSPSAQFNTVLRNTENAGNKSPSNDDNTQNSNGNKIEDSLKGFSGGKGLSIIPLFKLKNNHSSPLETSEQSGNPIS